MKKEFVPYEQALALKELGFDEPCLTWWNKKEFVYPYWDREFGYNYESGIAKDCVLSPLYQQAFRWLLILVNKDEHFSNKWTISYNEDYYSLFLGGCNMGVFKAELECLKKLIEITNEKI
jgi:hypothetical protein